MKSQKIQRLAITCAFAIGLASTGLAASAQTTTAPAATMTANATNVSMSTVDSRAKHQTDLEQASTDARRMLFRNQGTSL